MNQLYQINIQQLLNQGCHNTTYDLVNYLDFYFKKLITQHLIFYKLINLFYLNFFTLLFLNQPSIIQICVIQLFPSQICLIVNSYSATLFYIYIHYIVNSIITIVRIYIKIMYHTYTINKMIMTTLNKFYNLLNYINPNLFIFQYLSFYPYSQLFPILTFYCSIYYIYLNIIIYFMRNLTNKLISTFLFSTLKRTSLYQIHLAQNAKIVQFAGYQMPVQYPQGVLKQHLHCRNSVSLFDVSHMGQLILRGQDRLKFLERVTVGDVKNKTLGNIHQSYLSLFLNQNAGIIDDTIVTPYQNQIKLVVNGANKYIVLEHLNSVKNRQNFKVQFALDDSRSLVAIQGPKAAQTVEQVLKFKTQQIPFMSQFQLKTPQYQIPLWVARSGYTGEDGFQISFDSRYTNAFVNSFLKAKDVKFAGLGARDSLRVQAGLCLHGHDISDTITPFQGTLMWTVSKKKQNRTRFIGQDALEKQIADNKAGKNKLRKRVGFMLQQAGVVRQNFIIKKGDQQVGKVSSGTFSPCLRKGVGMMYVDQNETKQGTELQAVLKDRSYPIKVTKMPFVQTKYNRLWQKK